MALSSATIASCSPRAADATAEPPITPSFVAGAPQRPNVILSEEPWTFGSSRGVMIRTPSYRVFTTVTGDSLRARLPIFLEMAGAQYRSAITPLPSPDTALDTYVMGNHSEWAQVVTQLLGARAPLITTIDRGGFTLQGRSILYELGPRDTFVLLAHEGWHQFSQRTLREPLPIWLDEGLATWFEGHRWVAEVPVFTPRENPERQGALARAARTSSLISLEELVNTTPQHWIAKGGDWPLTYYAQAWALAHFLADSPTRREALAGVLMLSSRGRLRAELSRRLGDREAGIAMSRRLGPAVLEAFVDRDLRDLQRAYSEFMVALIAPTTNP